MPIYPMLESETTYTLNTQVFYGLNRGLSISDGEMQDMKNLCDDHYPVLSTRKGRKEKTWPQLEGGGAHRFAGDVDAMLGTDRLIVCQGGRVYVDGEVHGLTLSDEAHMKPKHMVSIGAYVCIWPDKKYLNLTNPEDYGDMGTRWTAADGTEISAVMCRMDGTDYDMTQITVSQTAPQEPQDQQLWLDTSGANHVLKQYSTIYQEWVQVATTFIKIQAEGIGKNIRKDDAVFLSGVRMAEDTGLTTSAKEITTLSFTSEDFSLYSSFHTTHYGGQNYVSTTATVSTMTKVISVTGIQDGAKVTKAEVHVTTGTSMYGARKLTLNGNALQSGRENVVPVEVSGNGEVSLKFTFQSNNSANVSGDHGGSMSFTGIRLVLTCEGASGAASGADDKQLEALNTSNTVYGCGENYIIVAGLLHGAVKLDARLVMELRIPDLDYVCESNNRLWGCSYDRLDGTLTNEIRACALGDFRNWYKFAGISTDSYAVSVGSDGKFTGAFSYQGTPVMFKEGFLHKISGTSPSNFALNTMKCRGVQDGSWRSLAMVNEMLMYKARGDVMVYDGSTPYSVSDKLGSERYYEGCAGAWRDKYYLNVRDEQSAWSMLVYDTKRGLWHREDEASVRHMASVSGELILAVGTDEGTELVTVGAEEEPVEWSATFGTFGFEYEEQKYLSRFNIRAQMSAGSRMRMEIMYDSSGEWIKAGETRCPALKTVLLPIIPRRCDHCQVRLSGTGTVRIYSIARVLRKGRDG